MRMTFGQEISKAALSATPSCAKTRPFETDHNISSLVSVFAPGPRACNSYSSFWLAGSTARSRM